MEKFEKESVDFPLRNSFVSSINGFIQKELEKALPRREEYTKNTPQEERRRDFKDMLGFPVAGKYERTIKLLDKRKIISTDSADVYRMRFDIMGINFYGLLFIPSGAERPLPLVIFQHGGDGTPELAGSLLESTYNYNGAIERIVKRKVAVFAPQTLIWKTDTYKSPYDRPDVNNRLLELGGSYVALEMRAYLEYIDYFSGQDYIDGGKIGFAGLSWGGMFALYAGAIDKRIKAVYSSCFFNDRAKYNSEYWSYKGQADRFFDAEVATLILPRYLCLECGLSDTLFEIGGAKAERERLLKYMEYFGIGEDKIRFNFFEGVHEFCPEDGALDWFTDKLLNG